MDTAQIEKLIKLVSCYPQLYNVNHIDHADQQKRDLIWKSIGDELDLTPDVCRAKWTILRSGYRKALRNSQNDTGRKKWRFEDNMSFLKDCIQNRSRTSIRSFEAKRKSINHISTTSTNLESEDDEDVGIKEEPEEFLLEEEMNNREDDRTSSCDSMTIAEALKMTSKYSQMNEKEKEKKEGDALTQFFLSMAETVKTFPPLVQAQVKAEVFNSVNAAEIKYLQEKN